jgi:hypothetical protein
MAITKYASFEGAQVLDVKSSPTRVKTASLDKMSDFNDYRTEDGYLYVRIRAQSSRVNKNHDGWPTAEMAGGAEAWEKISSQHRSSEGGFTVHADTKQKYGFPTFIGKPIFVDHHNSDPKRARGVIADSKFNVLDQKTAAEGDEYWSDPDNMDPEHFPPSEIELLLEVDAESFPKFAESIKNGDLDGFSMGCDVEYSKCSHCGNKATNPNEYCSHIVSKGAEHEFTSATGERTSKKSYENCYGIGYFEISGVFDPADDTALTKELVASVHKEASELPFEQPDPVQHSPSPEEVMQLARRMMFDNPGMQLAEAMGAASHELTGRFNIAPDQVQGGDGAFSPNVQVKDTIAPPAELALGAPGVTPRHQGSYLASRKVAQPDEPQEFHTKAPEDVDTMREEKICPLCGSDMDDIKCAVCGYEEPPEQLQNPDLTKADEADDLSNDGDQVTIPADDNVPPPADGEGQSYLKSRNPQPTASVNNEMRWTPKGIDTKTAAPKPQGDEPDETVTSDQTTPVTSTFRTAKQMIANAAKRNQENNMEHVAQGATPADDSAKAKKQVDVNGVGGVDEASAEAASKADARVDVEGKGGVIQDSNAEAAKPDEKENLGDRKQDNAGFQDGGKTGDPTKTFDNSNEPGSAVTDKAVQAAKQGTDPVDSVGKPDKRVNVDEEVSYSNPNGVVDQWTGTDGNGVTKQQNPVTKKVDPNIEVKAGFVSIAALKLADTEVELGLITKDEKYDRLAELADKDDVEIAAEHRALAKVKTAGLTRTASKGGASRMPSFNKIARDEAPAAQVINDDTLDSALFSR